MQNLCLTPGGGAMKPFPGFMRAYAYPFLANATAYINTKTQVVVYANSSPGADYEEAVDGYRIVSFPSEQTMQTGSGRGLAVIDEATGRVVAIAYHPGGVPIDMTDEGNWTPEALGRVSRYDEADYPALLNYRGLTHIGTDVDEHHVFDGNELRLSGMRPPHWPPRVSKGKANEKTAMDTAVARYGAFAVRAGFAPGAVWIVKVFGAWDDPYPSPGITYKENSITFYRHLAGNLRVQEIGEDEDGTVDLRAYENVGAFADAITDQFSGDPYGWTVTVGSTYEDSDAIPLLESLEMDAPRAMDVRDADVGTAVYARSDVPGESDPGVFFYNGEHNHKQCAWKTKDTHFFDPGLDGLAEGVPNGTTVSERDDEGDLIQWLPRVDWGGSVRAVSIVTFREYYSKPGDGDSESNSSITRWGTTPVMYLTDERDGELGGFIPGGVTQIKVKCSGIHRGNEDFQSEMFLIFEQSIDTPGMLSSHPVTAYMSYWNPSRTGLMYHGQIVNGMAILEPYRQTITTTDALGNPIAVQPAVLPSSGYAYKTMGFFLLGGLKYDVDPNTGLAVNPDENPWGPGNTGCWLDGDEIGYESNPFWPDADSTISPPYPYYGEQGHWTPRYPQKAYEEGSGGYIGFIVDSMQFLGGGGGGGTDEPATGHGTIIVDPDPETGSWQITGPDGTPKPVETGYKQYDEQIAGNWNCQSFDLSGYTKSATLTENLEPGGTITFEPAWWVNGSDVGTVSITTNIDSGPWTLAGPSDATGTGNYSNASAVPGGYTVTLGAVDGYRAVMDDDLAQTLEPGGSITFALEWEEIGGGGDDENPDDDAAEDPVSGDYTFGLSWWDDDLRYESAMSPLTGARSIALTPGEYFDIDISGVYSKYDEGLPVYAWNSPPARATHAKLYVTKVGWTPVDAATPQYRHFETYPLSDFVQNSEGERWKRNILVPDGIDDFINYREAPLFDVVPPVRTRAMVADGDRIVFAGQRDYSIGRVKYTQASKIVTSLASVEDAEGVESYEDWPMGYEDPTGALTRDLARQAIWGPQYEGDAIVLGDSARRHLVKKVLPGLSENLLSEFLTELDEWTTSGTWALNEEDDTIDVTGDASKTTQTAEEPNWTAEEDQTYIIYCWFRTDPLTVDIADLDVKLIVGDTIYGPWHGAGNHTIVHNAEGDEGIKLVVEAAADITVSFSMMSVCHLSETRSRELLLQQAYGGETSTESTYTILGQPQRVWWTSVDAIRGPDREAINLLNYLDLDMPGDEILGLVRLGEWVVAVGRAHLAWLGQDTGAVDGYSVAYPRPRTEVALGAVSGRCITQVDGNVALWLSPSGRLIQATTQGVQMLPVTERLQGLILSHEKITAQELRHAHGLYLPTQNWYVLCLPATADTYERTGDFGLWSRQRPLDTNAEESE